MAERREKQKQEGNKEYWENRHEKKGRGKKEKKRRTVPGEKDGGSVVEGSYCGEFGISVEDVWLSLIIFVKLWSQI